MPSEENTPKSDQQSIPSVNLIYAPEDPRQLRRSRKRRRGPAVVFRSATPPPPTQPPPSGEPEKPAEQEEELTLADAFSAMVPLDGTDSSDIGNRERAVRAVAFLLDYVSGIGNEKVDGYAATGLARCLEYVAEEMAFHRNCDAKNLRKAGGDNAV